MVIPFAEERLRGHHQGRPVPTLRVISVFQLSRVSKISYFDLERLRPQVKRLWFDLFSVVLFRKMYQQIIQLQVTMYDLPFIKVHKSFDNLSQYQLCFRLRKAFSFIEEGLESASVCILLNQIQITPRPNKLYRLDNMHAIQTFQYKQLAYYSLPPLLIFSRI